MCAKQGKGSFSIVLFAYWSGDLQKVEIWPQEKGEDNLWDFQRIFCALCFFFSVFVALL